VDRFDLEQQIMSCWNITDDLDLLLEKVEDNDELSNFVLGLKTIYRAKFERLFDIFEKVVF
jgi:hypothetical protein